MRVDKISRFIQAFGNPAPASKNENVAKEQSATAEAKASSAVKLADDFGNQKETEASDASDKVARIKAQVANGTYQANNQDVAQAVARELFA